MLQSMTSSVLLDLATLRHNLTEFKVRWLAHIEEWKAENRPTTSSMLVRIGRTHVAGAAYCRDLTEYNEPRDLSLIDTSPAKLEGDCYEVASALRAAARFLEVLNQLPGTPAVRDWQGDADELINIAKALTDDAAEFFSDQDSQQN